MEHKQEDATETASDTTSEITQCVEEAEKNNFIKIFNNIVIENFVEIASKGRDADFVSFLEICLNKETTVVAYLF